MSRKYNLERQDNGSVCLAYRCFFIYQLRNHPDVEKGQASFSPSGWFFMFPHIE